MRSSRPAVILVGTAMVVAGLTGCGGSSAPPKPVPGEPYLGQTITLYNGQHEQTTDALVAGFEKQTGVHVKVHSDDEDVLAQEIESEGSSSPADVFYTENSPALMALQGRGLLAPLPSAVVSEVPSQYSSPSGDWVGVSARVSVIVYNTSKLTPSELPTSILDLADPKWRGKLAIAPSETDFQPIVTAVAQAYGQKEAVAWLEGVKANGASHDEPDNETITADVNDGQAELGLINNYYWYRLQAEIGPGSMHSKIAFFPPHNPGYVVDVSGAGVLKSSHHQGAADALVQFLDSATGQQTIESGDSFEYPLRPGSPAAPSEVPFAQLQPYPISIAELGDGSAALQLLQQVQFF